ncbi:hypothetical protein K2X96_01910 [Patescibacteria group bacterium]|jgi:hypothetical protein|nr:hypothetical protein [Patescibacteria group bacterium]
MSQESFVFFLGLLVLVTPVLGIPGQIKEWMFVGFGTLIVISGYRLRRAAYLRSLEIHGGERRSEAFVENHLPLQERI